MPTKIYSHLVVSMLWISAARADDSYLNRHAEGWHFYEDRLIEETKEQESEKAEAQKPTPPIDKVMTATQKIDAIKRELKERLNKAIVEPTLANIKSYQVLQEVMMSRSQLFGQRWMESVYRNPELDYSTVYPTNSIGQSVHAKRRDIIIDQKLKAMSKTHGLFYFFNSTCETCHTFAPIVKRFAQAYGWKIVAVSGDGGTLPDFPEAIYNPQAVIKLGITHSPTLAAINPETQEFYYLSVGGNTIDQIRERVHALFKDTPGEAQK